MFSLTELIFRLSILITVLFITCFHDYDILRNLLPKLPQAKRKHSTSVRRRFLQLKTMAVISRFTDNINMDPLLVAGRK